METNKQKIKRLLLEQYELEYNSDKEDEGYHGRTLNYFNEVNKKEIINEEILDKIVNKYQEGSYKAVILIDGENIHYNFNRRKDNNTGKIEYFATETIYKTFIDYATILLGKSYDMDNVLFVVFSQEHAKNFYNDFNTQYLNLHNILFFTDAPSQSEVDDILLFLAFKRLVMERKNVYVRTNDKMSWLNIQSGSSDSRDRQNIFIRKTTQELLKKKNGRLHNRRVLFC